MVSVRVMRSTRTLLDIEPAGVSRWRRAVVKAIEPPDGRLPETTRSVLTVGRCLLGPACGDGAADCTKSASTCPLLWSSDASSRLIRARLSSPIEDSMRCGHCASDIRERRLDGRLDEAQVVIRLRETISRHRIGGVQVTDVRPAVCRGRPAACTGLCPYRPAVLAQMTIGEDDQRCST